VGRFALNCLLSVGVELEPPPHSSLFQKVKMV
jgi:hypothetical protein